MDTMKIFNDEFSQAAELIKNAGKIIIISHKSPDGDTLGANLALRLALKHQCGKEIVCACIDPPPANMDFLPEIDSFAREFDRSWADLLIAVDAGADYMLGYGDTMPKLFSGKPPMINIDHHASNNNYGAVNIVDPSAASATQIVYRFLNFCGLRIDRKIATCLLNGLYFDTGSFMHSNTTPETLETASNLLWRGADFKTIAKKQFGTRSIAQLKIYGKILERMHVNSKKMTVSVVSQKDFEETGAAAEDASGAIDYLNSVSDGKLCCLLHEDKNGRVKGSLRTRTKGINLSRLAAVFGGGGHVKASGFSLPGHFHKLNPRIVIDEPR